MVTELSAILEKVAFGAWEIEKGSDGYRLHRFRKERYADYAALDGLYFGEFAAASSGVRLDFLTDARRVSLDCSCIGISGAHDCLFGVDVNGKNLGAFGRSSRTNWVGNISFPLPSGVNRVTIWFPYMYFVTVRGLELEGATVLERPKTRARVLFYGDSITYGMSSTDIRRTFFARAASRLDLDTVNLAVGGARMFVHPILDPVDCDAVVVAYGANDWRLLTPAAADEIIPAFYNKLHSIHPGKPVLCVLPTWSKYTDRRLAFGSFDEYRAFAREQAERFGADVIDASEFVPADPAFFTDGLHPSDIGFDRYSDRFVPALDNFLLKHGL